MHENTSVTLSEHLEAFINRQIKSRRFDSVSEAICAGVKLLEEQEIKLTVLQQALIEGENSGKVEYYLDQLLAELDTEQVL